MRILTITHYQLPHWGGIELTAAALHARYTRLGHESAWLSSDLPAAAPAAGQVRVPASELPYRLTGVKYPLWGAAASGAVRRWVEWCDIVNPHDCLYPGTVLALHWARRLHKPLVLTQHAGPWPFYRSRVLRGVQLAAYHTLGLAVHRRVAQAVFISRAVEAWFAARVGYPRAPRFIANGVDTGLFSGADATARATARTRLGLPAGTRIVLYVGRFLFMKGLPVIEQLARRMPEALFVLIGAGPIEPRDWRLPNVQVVPVVDQAALRDYYRAGDVLVLPSTGEGFPLVVAEAMACGCPAVVSAETYAAWNEGREYFLVADPTPTAETVHALLTSNAPLLAPEARAAISAYARAHWDWDQAARSYLALFESMAL
ncbi:MAG: glycosyltransferase family 4 protein [Deltaproteobacteria bacterium]|nr:glycosyltransferase family 4 protein [Deltaproteobacteria bacterium]